MVINIIGYYGNNFGDLLMLQGILNSLPSKYTKVNILSFDNLNLLDLDYSCNATVESHYIRMPLKKLIGFYKEANVIMWGGGSCFNDIDGSGGIKQMLLAKLINHKVQIIYYGVGIDIKKKICNKLYLRLALNISKQFAVRDENSYRLIKKYSCAELIDDPIYLNKEWLYSINKNIKKNNSLVISYRCVDKYYPKLYKAYIENFIQNIKSLLSIYSFSEIHIINADNNVDKNDSMHIFQEISSFCNQKISYVDKFTLREICNIIGSASLVITGRLHIAAVASMYKTPSLLLNYSEKNRQFSLKENSLTTLIEYFSLYDKNYIMKLISTNRIRLCQRR